MAKVIKVNVKEHEKDLNKQIPFKNNEDKSVLMRNIEKKQLCEIDEGNAVFTVFVSGFVPEPKVGSKVTCKKQPPQPLGYESICVSSTDGEVYGYILEKTANPLLGTMIDDELFQSLPDKFTGEVIYVGNLDKVQQVIVFEADLTEPEPENVFTVVSPGHSLLAPHGTFFNAVKEKRFNGNANIFAVYDGDRKIGIIAPMTRVAIPGTKALTLMESVGYPNSFPVKVVGEGCYDGTNFAIKVELMLPYKVPTLSEEEITKIDKKILHKYLMHLQNPHFEWTTQDMLMLSDKGKEKKALLDEKYQEVMKASVKKMQAYFDLL